MNPITALAMCRMCRKIGAIVFGAVRNNENVNRNIKLSRIDNQNMFDENSIRMIWIFNPKSNI